MSKCDEYEIPAMKPLVEQFISDFRIQQEEHMVKAVGELGICVDKARLLKALADARAFYEEGYRAAMRRSEWISVKERLPEDKEPVLIWVYDAYEIGWYRTDIKRWESELEKNYGCYVTHWMPLPQPPVVIAENATASKEV